MTNDFPRNQSPSYSAIEQQGSEIAAIVLQMYSSAAEREGVPPSREHLLGGIEVMLSAAWAFAKLADANEDGARIDRYAKVISGHLEGIKKNEP